MADTSNLKSNEFSNLERPTYESLKQEIEIEKTDLYQRKNMRIDKIANSPEYRMDEQFQNCSFFQPNFGFQN